MNVVSRASEGTTSCPEYVVLKGTRELSRDSNPQVWRLKTISHEEKLKILTANLSWRSL